MHVLVTGGAGFIGGHIAETLATDHDVTVLDNFEPYYDLGIKEHNVEAIKGAARNGTGSFELVEGSITDEDLVDDLVSTTDVVYRQAAQAGVRKSVEQPTFEGTHSREISVLGLTPVATTDRMSIPFSCAPIEDAAEQSERARTS